VRSGRVHIQLRQQVPGYQNYCMGLYWTTDGFREQPEPCVLEKLSKWPGRVPMVLQGEEEIISEREKVV